MINLFYLLIAVLPLENHWLWRYELAGSFTLLKAVGLVCLAGALVVIGQRGLPRPLLRSWPIRLYLAYLTAQCASYFVHGDARPVDVAMYMNVLSVVSLAIVTVAMVRSPLTLRRTLLLCIGGAAFASLYTIRSQQGAPNIADFRPSGIFDDANYYALVVGLWIPLSFLWSLVGHSKIERIFCAACLAAMLLGTTFAASRGGFFGLAAALLFMVWHSRRRFRNFAIVTALMLPLLVIAPNSPLQRLLHPGYGDMQARDARLIAWTAGLRMIRAHPWTGVGLGNFKTLMPSYAGTDVDFASVAHNTYIEDAAELGITGLLVHLAMLGSTFTSLGRVRRHAAAAKWTHAYQTAVGLQAGLLSYVVSAFFVSSWWQKIPWLIVFLAVPFEIIAAGAIRKRRQHTKRAEMGRAPSASKTVNAC